MNRSSFCSPWSCSDIGLASSRGTKADRLMIAAVVTLPLWILTLSAFLVGVGGSALDQLPPVPMVSVVALAGIGCAFLAFTCSSALGRILSRTH